jgi:hypothetical protein
VDSKTLTRNTRIIAEALTRVIYNLTEKVRPLLSTPLTPGQTCPCPCHCQTQSVSLCLSAGDTPRHASVHRADGKGRSRQGSGTVDTHLGLGGDQAAYSRCSRSSWTP